MQDKPTVDKPWVLFRLQGQVFGIPAEDIQEMVVLPEVTVVPRAPAHVRGVINLRGSVIALIDLRSRLNLPSLKAELAELAETLAQRKQDHLNWLHELERCANTPGATFSLAQDPEQCAFGRWYKNYKPNNPYLHDLLARFAQPHRHVHEAAAPILAAASKGDAERANFLINQAKNDSLAHLLELFDEAQTVIASSSQEVAVVVERGGQQLAFTVDAVDSVENLSAGSIEDMPGTVSDGYKFLVSMIGRREQNNESVLIINMDEIMAESHKVLQIDGPAAALLEAPAAT